MIEISDEMFAQEMKILWQNSNLETRTKLRNAIESYFDQGDRGYRLIEKMQCSL